MVRKFLFYTELTVLIALQLFSLAHTLSSWLPASAQLFP